MSDPTTELGIEGAVEPETLDAIFAVMADQRRRTVLALLRECEDPISLADLADEVAIREKQLPITEISPEYVKDVYLSLYHAHIPKLDAADLVAYMQERDLVRPSDSIELVDPLLAITKSRTR